MSTERSPWADLSHIQQALSVILKQGTIAELRILNTGKGTVSGYFSDFDKLARVASAFSGKAPGVYVTLNPVNPVLLSRAMNRTIPYTKHTTSDSDILLRRWLPADTDASRPAGVSSTDAEHDAALERARAILGFLPSLGFPEDSLLLADSGNGGHLLIRIDLPNDAESTSLLQRCLRALDLHFSDDAAHVDLTTYNAARIWKVYGTLAAKGDSMPERPHRLGRLLKVPAEVTAAPREALERLATMVPAQPKPEAEGPGDRRFDLAAWIAEHDLKLVRCKPWNGGTLWILAVCPWNPEHCRGEAYIVQFSNGTIAAGCHHNSCQHWGWKELRSKYERIEDVKSRPSAQDTRAKAEVAGNGQDPAAPNSQAAPIIIVRGRFLREITTEALAVVERANSERPALFQRGGALVRLRRENGALLAQPLSHAALKGLLDRVADFVTMNRTGKEQPARPPDDVVADILSLADLPFPELRSIAGVPVVLPGGRLLITDGFDPGSGVYVHLNGLELAGATLPPSEALQLLSDELLVDFPFADEGSYAHALGFLLQPFVRPLIVGATPLYLIDAPTPGTGKDLLAQVGAELALGRPASATAELRDENEGRKRITAILLAGTPIVVMDNIRALRSSALAAALTAEWWEDRILGRSQMVRLRNDAVWVATGNNVVVSDEIARRIIPIRLDAGVEHPEERTGFRHSALLKWVRSNRSQLVAACLSVVKAWIDSGMPQGNATLGSYESWAQVMGGILEVAGVQGFLEGRHRLYSEADHLSQEWTAFCTVWWRTHGGHAVTAGTLLQTARDNNLLLDLWGGRSALSAQQRLGHALMARRDRVFGMWAIRYAGRDASTGNAAYRLEQKTFGPSTVFQTPETPEALSAKGSSGSGKTPPEHPKNTRPVPDTRTNSGGGVSGVSGVSFPIAGRDPWDDFLQEVESGESGTED